MAQTYDLSDVQAFSTLSMPVILRTTDAYDDIVAIQLTARGGVNLSAKPGTLELLLKTLTSGTTSYSKEQIDQILTEYGAVFSVDARMDYIQVSLKCLKKFLPNILPVISEMLRTPLLSTEEIELSRAQLLSGLKQEQDHPDSVLQLIASKAFYQGHPYYQRPEGYLETLPTITRDDMVETLSKMFNTDNVFFSIVGDLKRPETEELIIKYFGSLPAGSRKSHPSEPFKNKTGEVFFQKVESPTTYFIARFKAPSLTDEDYPALVLASQILDNRLFEEVRTKRGLTYAVSASIGNSGVNSGVFYVTSTQIHDAVRVMFDEVHKMQSELVDARNLELQVRKFTSSWWLSREQSVSQVKIFSLYEAIGPGWQASNSFIDRLNRVTPEQILNVSKKYFKDYTLALVGPEATDLSNIEGLKLPLKNKMKTKAPTGKSKPAAKPVKSDTENL